MEEIYKIFLKAIMITGFVFIMMIVVEYINVQSKGVWQKHLTGNIFKPYFIAGLLGALPGCLGAFTVITLFSHKLISFGALVTTMIATSGDEAFVMFAMFPKQAMILTILLMVLGILAGYLTDKFYHPKRILDQISGHSLMLHEEEYCKHPQLNRFWKDSFHLSLPRISVALGIITLMVGVVTGLLAGNAEMWVKVTLLAAFAFALFIIVTVPDHFLIEHVWKHIVKVHMTRIFLWVYGILLIMHVVNLYIDIESWISHNLLVMLLIAVFVGFIPESGPHLIFVTLFAAGAIPFSILLASSISQDGHGMLPMLAESKKGFVAVQKKAVIINMIYALVIGGISLSLGL
jgi:hypothetical protein